jgi:two-component system, chemotaxis family, sensor kinase CheA
MTTLERKEFVAGYLVEADEHLKAANANLLAVEAKLAANEPHPRLVRELFRSLHTLKGLSAMVGVDPVVELAHEMETILRHADRGAGTLSAMAVELLLTGVREIELRVKAFALAKPVAPAPQELLNALAALQAGAATATPRETSGFALDAELASKLSAGERLQLQQGVTSGRRALKLDFVPTPARSADGITITTVRQRVAAVAEIVKVIPRSLPKSETAPGGLAFTLLVLSDVADKALAEAAYVAADAIVLVAAGADSGRSSSTPPADTADFLEDEPIQTGSIRVDVSRLDEALEKLSALVVTRFRLARAVAQLHEQGADVRALNAVVQDNARQLRDLRACIMRARTVPVKDVLDRVPLIVRGMSRTTGKRVRLSVESGQAELDKAVAERVFPAIVHLVRNAIDHAIEPAAERARLGKPEEGSVVVRCFEHSSRELELSITDDGRGIDAQQIAAKAGRPVPADAEGLLALITLPGLSTMDQPTASSGRGMGMDIVKRIAVDTLGGLLTLRTAPNVGTTFTLRIPLSLLVLDAFLFMCSNQLFVVPVAMVDEIVELDPSTIVSTPAPSGGRAQMIERRGSAMPLLSLAGLLALAEAPGVAKALVVRREQNAFAFAVDRLVGQQEIVVRPLEDPLVKVAGVTGTTDLGDGRPTLVLDLMGLIQHGLLAPRSVAA